ncbi:hypothetical protein LI291_01880 [Intestinibacillus massiliensis]|nr:hypothetical protein [Intestinibacillus massiliensis]
MDVDESIIITIFKIHAKSRFVKPIWKNFFTNAFAYFYIIQQSFRMADKKGAVAITAPFLSVFY